MTRSPYVEVRLDLPWLPPSLNAISTKGGHWRYTKAKKEAQAILVPALTACAVNEALPYGRVYAAGHLIFPRRGRRDQGNYRSTLEKFLGDALQAAGWLKDDNWDTFEFGDLTYAYVKGVSRTQLELMPRGRG